MFCSWTFSPPLSYPSLLHLNSFLASHFSNLWGKQNRIVGDIFLKVMTSLICNGAGVLKAALSLPLAAAGSQLSNLVVHPYQLSRPPPPSPEECRTCVILLSCSVCPPHPALWKALAHSSWIPETGRCFKMLSFCKRWIRFILDTG